MKRIFFILVIIIILFLLVFFLLNDKKDSISNEDLVKGPEVVDVEENTIDEEESLDESDSVDENQGLDDFNGVLGELEKNNSSSNVHIINESQPIKDSETDHNNTAVQKFYTVRFFDHNGNMLKSERVKHGESATKPDLSSREGYDFVSWSADTDFVTKNLNVYPNYEVQKYEVLVNDAIGVRKISLPYGFDLSQVVASDQIGKSFVSWKILDKDHMGTKLTFLKGNTTIEAEYATNQTQVIFKGLNGRIISDITYDYGQEITVPSDVDLLEDSSNFIKWDKELVTKVIPNKLKETVIYQAVYEIKTFDITIKTNVDGVNPIIIKDVEFGTSIEDLILPEVEGHTFIRFNTDANLVKENLTIDAEYEINKLNVIVLDQNNEELFNEIFEYGQDTLGEMKDFLEKEELDVEGYDFIRWDNKLDSIATPESLDDKLVIKPILKIKTFEVVYQDHNGKVIGKELVDWNTHAENAPATKEVEGYHFVEWRTLDGEKADFKNIKEDVVFKAHYEINVYDVVFKDANDNIIKTDKVEHGSSAEAPTAEEANVPFGYHFVRWSVATDIVTQDVVVVPEYDINVYDVVFKDADGKVIKTIKVEHGSDVLPLSADEVEAPVGYDFKEWQVDGERVGYDYFKNIESDIEVVAAFGKQIKNVTFVDFDGNEIDVFGIEYGSHFDTDLLPQAPEVIGYRFVKWDLSEGVITEHVTIRPVYEEKFFSVTFVVDGEVYQVQDIQEGQTLKGFAAPEKTGYTFIGWDYNNEPIMEDLVVNAEYEINKYNVVIKDNETEEKIIVEHGSNVELPEPKGKEGHTFSHWTHSGETIEEDTVIEAVYDINTYSVKIHDEGVVTELVVEYGKDVEFPEPQGKEGHTFSHWSHDGKFVKEDMVIHANYEINKYAVTFKDETGKVVAQVDVPHGSSVEAPVAPEKEGYHFVKWSKDITNVTEDITVTPIYEINVYEITYIMNEEEVVVEVEHGQTPEIPEVKETEGFKFVRWDKIIDKATGDTTVRAIYEIEKFTITYLGSSGHIARTEVVEYGQDAVNAPNATNMRKEGYEFVGWDKDLTNIKSDITVNPKYELLTAEYEFRSDFIGIGNQPYDYHGKKGESLIKVVLPYGSEVSIDPQSGRVIVDVDERFNDGTYASFNFEIDKDAYEGYAFHTTKDLGARVLPQKSGEVYASDIIYKAKEVSIQVTNEKGRVVERGTVNYGESFTPSQSAETAVKKSGYILTGWDKDLTDLKDDVIVKPVYAKEKYTVTFKDHNGDVLLVQEVLYGDTLTNIPTPKEREGYDFKGWKGGSLTEPVTQDLELVADFEIKTYTVGFASPQKVKVKKDGVYQFEYPLDQYNMRGQKITVKHGQTVQEAVEELGTTIKDYMSFRVIPITYNHVGWLNADTPITDEGVVVKPLLEKDSSASVVTISLSDGEKLKVRGYFDKDRDLRLLEELNEYRLSKGSPKIEWNEHLYNMAKMRAAEQYINPEGSLSHTRPNGKSFNYVADYYRSLRVAMAENVSSDLSLASFKNSPGHNASMLSENYKSYGGATFRGEMGYAYVQLFSPLETNDLSERIEEFSQYNFGREAGFLDGVIE